MRKSLTVLGLIILIALLAWHITRQVIFLRDSGGFSIHPTGPADSTTDDISYDVERIHSEPLPISVTMVPVANELKGQWPGWRGASSQGIASGPSYPDTWSESANVIWKVDIPGQGNSSPIVASDRVFLTTAYDEGQRRSVICARQSDGEPLWETFAPEGQVEDYVHDKASYAASTPCTDGRRVFSFLGTFGVLCLDLDGKKLWHREMEISSAEHGSITSPLIFKDMLVLYQDQGDGSFVTALDTQSGQSIWRTQRRATAGWSSPVAIRAGDRDMIVISSESEVTAYDPDSGEEIWHCEGNSGEVIPTPVVGQGLLFCCSGYSGPTLAIHPGGVGDVTDTHLVWLIGGGSPYIPSPLLYGDYLYMINDNSGVVRCYEARTGKEMWRNRLRSDRGASRGQRPRFSASPVGVDDKVFFTNERGETFVLKAGPKFRLLGVNTLGDPVLTSPALVDGRWYFRTNGSLICIGEEP